MVPGPRPRPRGDRALAPRVRPLRAARELPHRLRSRVLLPRAHPGAGPARRRARRLLVRRVAGRGDRDPVRRRARPGRAGRSPRHQDRRPRGPRHRRHVRDPAERAVAAGLRRPRRAARATTRRWTSAACSGSPAAARPTPTSAGSPTCTTRACAGGCAGSGCPRSSCGAPQDGIVTPDYGRVYASEIPGSRFEVIEDAGHYPHVEQPQLFAELVRTFVRSTTVAGKGVSS